MSPVEDRVLAGVAVALSVVVACGLVSTLGLILARLGRRRMSRQEKWVAWASVAMLGALVLAFEYAKHIEANWLSETRVELETDRLPRGERLRIVLLSDLHVDDPSPVLDELPARINALSPDLFVFTGDSINRRDGAVLFRQLLGRFNARLGRFAVRGNHDVWYWSDIDLFGGGVATELTGDPITLDEGRITLCGAPYARSDLLAPCLAGHAKGLRLVAYHTPDLVEDLAALGEFAPDLYLAGHTHGGQVRAPFFGALATASRFYKRYEMGLYHVGPTTLFVSRGIGFEPAPSPRIRFLCRPELAVLDLIGTGAP
jgi:predicted MPP superfamily phosphohydrolase